jgi:hypothetical protein
VFEQRRSKAAGQREIRAEQREEDARSAARRAAGIAAPAKAATAPLIAPRQFAPLPPRGDRPAGAPDRPAGKPVDWSDRSAGRDPAPGERAIRHADELHHHADWAHSLTPRERAAMEDYKESGYRGTNDRLRAGAAAPESQAIDSALAKHPLPHDYVTHRAATSDDIGRLNALPDHAVAGAAIHDKAYLSTSLDPGAIHEFRQARHDSASFRIRVPAGTHAAYMEHFNANKYKAKEHELLLPRGGHIRITGRREALTNDRGGAHHVYDAEFVAGDHHGPQ